MTPSPEMSPQRLQALLAMIRENRGTYFEWLGLTPAATAKEIDSAYRGLRDQIEAHSDPTSDDEASRQAMALSAALARAYETLSDYGKRGAYEKRGYRPEGFVEAKDDPAEQARTLQRKAKTLYSQKKFQLGARLAGEAIQLQPDKAEYYLLLGLCQTEIPELKRQAEATLLKAVEMEPWNAEHYTALGLLFHSARLPKRAESYYRKALSLEPGHAVARRKLSEITGPTKGALQQLKESIQQRLQKYLPSLFGRRGGK